MAGHFKEKEIIMILGAGASVEAGIPHSAKMIEELENLVRTDDEWKILHDLYFYIKGTFQYGNALRKISNPKNPETYYNIESLYVALDELSKRDEHSLFPFIGAWNPKLSDVAGNKFENVRELKQKIYDKIRKWVGKTQEENIEYYENLFKFRIEYENSLRIFSMNYDLCVEKTWNSWSLKNKGYDIELERGFYSIAEPEVSKKRCWDWKRLDGENQINNEKQPVFLYKLHGSIDWKTDGEKIKFEDGDGWSEININDSVFIFGETNKLHYNDPFFYLFQEFRKWTLSSKLMISLGYSFGDPHINNVIRQSLLDNPNRKLLVVSPYRFNGDTPVGEDEIENKEEVEENRVKKIRSIHDLLKLGELCENQIAYWFYGAKAFMSDKLKIEDLASLFPENEVDLIEEVEMNDEEIAESDASIESDF
jgi:hypothetical protein